MSVKLENKYLLVKVKQKGAELFSVVNKENQLEYMWSGDPVYWGKTSPVLFPIVGTLKNKTYLFKGKSYSLTRHGFARDATFNIITQDKDHVVFSLKSGEETLRTYPFQFELRITYTLKKKSLGITYEVLNTGQEQMYFSIGGHPAFKVPLAEHSNYNDYYLEFDTQQDIDHWPISHDGLIELKSVPLLINSNKLKLSHELFYHDALVLKNYKMKKISLKSTTHDFGLNFHFEGFPFFGIWAAKDADFVCLEPWCGIADSVAHDQHFETKEGIQMITPEETWSRTWRVELF